MKYGGIVFFLLGLWWAYIWRHDPCEGMIMRPVGWLGAAGGVFLFLEGLKREIIDALKQKSGRDRSE